ncbi:MAG: hypothetical protein ABIL49_08235 [candidate division WOR-3 bacterium]
MKKFLILFLFFIACRVGDPPEKVVERYLSALEKGDYKTAYKLIDKISQNYVSEEDFIKYWENKFNEWGKPDSHEVYAIKREADTMRVYFRWYFNSGHFEDLVMRLSRTVDQGVYEWRIKFLNYRIIERKKK